MTTAIIEASTHGQLEVVKTLLEHGADATIRSMMDGWTALEAAAKSGHPAVAEELARHLGVPVPRLAKNEADTERGFLRRLLSRLDRGD